jgi:PAS domain S-box-containing protein
VAAAALCNPRAPLRVAMIIAVYLVAFIILDFLSLQFEELRGVVAWYPPAGLAYALLLVFGVRFAPAVTLTLFISSLFIYRMPQPPYLLLLWAVIISLIYAVAAAFLRHRTRFNSKLRQLRDVTWLVVTAVFVSALLAVISVLSSALSSDMAQSQVLRAIFLWWIGETIGVLTVTPFLLIHVTPWLKRFADGQPVSLPLRRSFPRLSLSVIGQAFSIAFVFYWVFGARGLDEFRPMYLITLPLIWIALDHGIKGIAAGIVVLNFGATFAMWIFRFDLVGLGELQLLMIINCVVGLLMGAVVTERKRAEQALRESEEKFSMIFSASPVAISISRLADGKMVEINKSFVKMFGYTREEAIGRTSFELELVVDSQARTLSVQGLSKQDELNYIEMPLRTKHKDIRDTLLSSQSIVLRGEGHVLSIIYDITERKRAEQSIASLAKYPSENPNPVLRLDRDGVVIDANPASGALLSMWGCGVGGTAPQFWRDLAALVLASRENKIVDIECDGKTYSMFVAPVAEPGYVNLYGRDITERKQAESQLQERLNELQRWYNVSLGREKRILDLKREVNGLLGKAGQTPRYSSAESEN